MGSASNRQFDKNGSTHAPTSRTPPTRNARFDFDKQKCLQKCVYRLGLVVFTTVCFPDSPHVPTYLWGTSKHVYKFCRGFVFLAMLTFSAWEAKTCLPRGRPQATRGRPVGDSRRPGATQGRPGASRGDPKGTRGNPGRPGATPGRPGATPGFPAVACLLGGLLARSLA